MSDEVINHLSGKVVIVTGAAGGFGRLLAEKAARLGAHVVGADVDGGELDRVVAAISAAGGSALAVPTDVTDLSAVRELVKRAVEHFERVDVMVNNAGVMPLAFFADHAAAADAWSRCIDINIKGVLHGIMAVYDPMIAQGRGHVVNLSSIYGNFPVAGGGVYGATKAAVNFLSEALRVEARGRIKVTTIKPTGVPATGLSTGIVNPDAVVGILGQNAPAYLQQMAAHAAGELPPEQMDAGNIEYYALEPEHLAEQIVYAINQPWGVALSELTVRASGDAYIL